MAQATPQSSESSQGVNIDEIFILVNLTAKELKFEVVPNPTVEFLGTHERSKIWITQRQNLPDQVEPGVTYRNTGIQLRISSRFKDIERIVHEALGEIPIIVSPQQPPVAKSATKQPGPLVMTPPIDPIQTNQAAKFTAIVNTIFFISQWEQGDEKMCF